MDQEEQELLMMELNLQQALKRKEVHPAFQPIVDEATGKIRGFEGLMRWSSPEHGFVPPSRFIPMLESTGLILPFGEWMLRTCCEQNKVWQERTGMKTHHLRERFCRPVPAWELSRRRAQDS